MPDTITPPAPISRDEGARTLRANASRVAQNLGKMAENARNLRMEPAQIAALHYAGAALREEFGVAAEG